MTPNQAVELLTAMVRIDSRSGREAELAGYLTERMRSLGMEARIDAAGNAVGEVGQPGRPEVMLLGHLDTVGGVLPVVRTGSELTGRGAVDAKGALAAFVVAADAARDLPLRIAIVGAVEEEATSHGALHLLATHRPDAVMIGEPSGATGVVLGYKGCLALGYSVRCAPHHASRPDAKATELAVEWWQGLRAELNGAAQTGPMFDRVVPALVSLDGDLREAHARVQVRVPPRYDDTTLVATARRLAGPGEVRVLENVPAYRARRDNPVARALTRALAAHGMTARHQVKSGTSDMNVVAPRWGVPVAAYGPGDPALDHTDAERIDLEEYLLASRVLETALRLVAKALPLDWSSTGGTGDSPGGRHEA